MRNSDDEIDFFDFGVVVISGHDGVCDEIVFVTLGRISGGVCIVNFLNWCKIRDW